MSSYVSSNREEVEVVERLLENIYDTSIVLITSWLLRKSICLQISNQKHSRKTKSKKKMFLFMMLEHLMTMVQCALM
jgi:hypothetical protein